MSFSNDLEMIRLEEVDKTYFTGAGQVQALSGINLQVQQGEIFGIIGKSGAGKSTLLRCINLLERPTHGKVIVAGQDLTALSTAALRQMRRKIGIIFQHFNLLNSRTAYGNIAFPLELAGTPKAEIAKIIAPLLELTGLTDKQDSYPHQLSGGQKQRVAIARALACDPKVLLCDEATSALDPETTQSILSLLKNIRDRLQLTIFLITHEMTVIKACCDRVAILHNGKLIEENEVGTFFAHPQTDIAKNFIASSIPQELPQTLRQHLVPEKQANTHPVLRLWFLAGAATQPIISQLARQFGLSINILQANVEYIKKHAIGIMIIAIDGDQEKMHASIKYLESLHLKVEVIGYVSSDVVSFTD